MQENWRVDGFTSPNAVTYPWQWLWDSCFHALIWQRLGRPDRAVAELGSLFADQGSTGFVPHMRYVGDPEAGADFWGRSGTSSITQPPMFGHAVAELVRSGIEVGDLVEQAAAAVHHLLDRPPTPAGLVPIFHPWESGCDDSPRWDDVGPFDVARWRADKGRFVASLRFDESGAPVANPTFSVGSIGFNALVAFNAAELVSIGVGGLAADVRRLTVAIGDRHTDDEGTWVDDSSRDGASVRTLDAHLAILVADGDHLAARATDLVAHESFGAPFGPGGVARHEPVRCADQYWRGPSWPQLSYLLWVACRRRGRPEAASIAATLRRGVHRSGHSEYWNPDTGAGLGARPQSWSCLGSVLD